MPLKDDAYYDSLPADSDDWSGPSMYSTEGDDAVRAAVAKIAACAADHGLVWNKATLTEVAKTVLAPVIAEHPEVYDTEPRCWIANKLDAICEQHGWAYNAWEGYEW